MCIDNNKNYMYIGDVVKITGISPSRIRDYEKERLIKPDREKSTNRRIYTEFEVNQIKKIYQFIHKYGFTISSIKFMANRFYCWQFFKCKDKTCPSNKKLDKCHVKNFHICCRKCIIYLNRFEKKFNYEIELCCPK